MYDLSIGPFGGALESNMNVVDDALNFDPSRMQLITTYEGLNVYYDGKSYYCKGVIKLEAEKMYNHYQENDHRDLMKALNDILASALVWGSSSPTSPTNSPNIGDAAVEKQNYTTWTVAVPFMRQRVYAYTRDADSITMPTGQRAFVLVNESIKDPIPISYFSYQVFNYSQKAVLIQQKNGLCFVYVRYHDPDTVVPVTICNWVVQLYVPYFVKRMYRSCEMMNNISQDSHIRAINDTLEQGIQKGFAL